MNADRFCKRDTIQKHPKAKSARVKIHSTDAIWRAFVLLLVARTFKDQDYGEKAWDQIENGELEQKLLSPLDPRTIPWGTPHKGLGASQMSFCVYLSHVPFYRSHRNGNEGDPEGRAALQSAPPTTQLLAEWETATSPLQTNNVGFLARNNSLNKEKKKLLLFIVFVMASSCDWLLDGSLLWKT